MMKLEKTVKINSVYYQKYILTLIFKEKILLLYPNNLQCVKLYQDKVPSHTFKSTAVFFENFEMKPELKLFFLNVSHQVARCVPYELLCF